MKPFTESIVEDVGVVQVGLESAKLATLRDYLLPRLLSGRVGEAPTVKLWKDS